MKAKVLRSTFEKSNLLARHGRLVLNALIFCLLHLDMVYGQSGTSSYEDTAAAALQAQSAGDIPAAVHFYQIAVKLRPGVPELWSNLGLMQHQQKDYAGALKSFSAAHTLAPKLFVPVLFIGIEDMELGNSEQAIESLILAEKLNPEDPNVPTYLGKAYFAARRYSEAAEVYTKVVAMNPRNGEAWYRLGVAHLEMAEKDSSLLATNYRDTAYFHALEAETFSNQNHFDRGVTAYTEALKPETRPPCLRSGKGWALLHQKKLDDAETQFRLDAKDGGCLDASLGEIRIAFERSVDASSLRPIQNLWLTDAGFVLSRVNIFTSGLSPEDLARLATLFDETSFDRMQPSEIAQVRMALYGEAMNLIPAATAKDRSSLTGRNLYLQGRYKECQRKFFAVSTVTPDQLSLLAQCSFFTGDFEASLDAGSRLRRSRKYEAVGLYWSVLSHQRLATQDLVRAGEADPNSVHVHNLLAETYRDMENYTAANAEYEAALKLAPEDIAALIGSSATFLQAGSIDSARSMISRALGKSPEDPEANYIAGELDVEERKFDDAEKHLKLALNANAQLLPRVHALFGRIYASRGEDELAVKELELGLESDDEGATHFQLARLYQKLGRREESEQLFLETKKIQDKRHAQ